MGFQDSQLASNTQGVLKDKATAWISFTLGSITVKGSNYAGIDSFITSGKIKCVVDASKIPGGASAIYDPSTKTIFGAAADLPYAEEKSTMIHECTHAVLDTMKTSTTVLSDETCAYLAQAIFVFAMGVQATFSSGSIAAEAYNVVKGKNVTMSGTPDPTASIAFSATDVLPLQASIKKSPIYKNAWKGPSNYSGLP